MATRREEGEELLVDRAAAAIVPGEAELRQWAAEQRVFVSSVMADYEDYRQAAMDAIEDSGAVAVDFELFGGRDSDPEQAYLNEVSTSTIYVGLLGARYGRPLPSRFSATHAEYLHAEQEGLRVSVWSQTGIEMEGHQQAFLNEAREFHVVDTYGSPDRLRSALTQRLKAIAAEDLSPWCKLGRLVFRGREISEHGNRLTVRATVHDPDLAAELLALNDQWGRRQLSFTYGSPARCLAASVTSLQATTRAARAKDFESS